MSLRRTFMWSIDQHIDRVPALKIFDEVRQRYLDVDRHYHDWDHVTSMVDSFISLPRDMIDHPRDVIAAIVFHDAIYDPRRSDNEEASAALAAEELSRLPEDRRQRISDLILATDHRRPPNSSDEALICDIDLTVLGADASRYQEYVTAVRTEYGFVPEDAWNAGRAKVLSAFLERDQIFRTPSFAHLERKARDNIEGELRALRTEIGATCI